MNTRSAEELMREAGISERDAWAVVSVYVCETDRRIDRLRRLQKLNKLRFIDSHVRCIPWPHVAEYNEFVRTMVMARTTAELKPAMLAVKEQVARRVNHNTWAFSTCSAWYPLQTYQDSFATLSKAEVDSARKRIVSILQVGDDGNPLGGPETGHWFEQWRFEADRELRQSASAPSGNSAG